MDLGADTVDKTAAIERTQFEGHSNFLLENNDESSTQPLSGEMVQWCHIPAYPNTLTETESLLLDHYIRRFSRTYPTFSGPTNPFLSVLLPLSMRHRVVLDSLLALSGAQTWKDRGFSMDEATLKLRQRALRGCRKLLMKHSTQNQLGPAETPLLNAQVTNSDHLETMGEEDLLFLLTICVMLLLYEKIAGEGQENWTPHLEFLARLFSHSFHHYMGNGTSSTNSAAIEAFRFLYNLFLYNDLVRSISAHTAPLSDFYLRIGGSSSADAASFPGFLSSPSHEAGLDENRYYYPHLIARISAGDRTVTDADIAAWDGRVDWLPSFPLAGADGNIHGKSPFGSISFVTECPHRDLEIANGLNKWDERKIISELYRVAARVYRMQAFCRSEKRGEAFSGNMDAHESQIGILAPWAVQLIQQLPEGSVFESALLWPIGIVSKDLTRENVAEREYILFRLQCLERRFQMKHFRRVQELLVEHWMKFDQEMAINADDYISRSATDVILLG